MSKTINKLIQQFRESIPYVHNGCPSKDFIDDRDVYLVAEELLRRLDKINKMLNHEDRVQHLKSEMTRQGL